MSSSSQVQQDPFQKRFLAGWETDRAALLNKEPSSPAVTIVKEESIVDRLKLDLGNVFQTFFEPENVDKALPSEGAKKSFVGRIREKAHADLLEIQARPAPITSPPSTLSQEPAYPNKYSSYRARFADEINKMKKESEDDDTGLSTPQKVLLGAAAIGALMLFQYIRGPVAVPVSKTAPSLLSRIGLTPTNVAIVAVAAVAYNVLKPKVEALTNVYTTWKPRVDAAKSWFNWFNA